MHTEREDAKKVFHHGPSARQWEKVVPSRRSGVVVPLFSVYSENSLGIGDLSDLHLVIDWAHKTGNSIVQLLPMNETGFTHCPYDSISSFALDPVYLSVDSMGEAKRKKFAARIDDIRHGFPIGKKAHVDYRIKKEKENLFWDMYCQENESPSPQFRKFVDAHANWLTDFALFKVLKAYHNGSPWYEWGAQFQSRDHQALTAFYKEHSRDVDFQMWLQWQLYRQFKEVKKYAESRHVLLKGDFPILVSKDSADVWAHQEFFKLDFAAGAPPDMYCERGQRWGTPTYDWEEIAADGYTYLAEKLSYAENFYHLLRIDHVVGLFRIWSIACSDPEENKGLNGSFDPWDEAKWGEQGRRLLSVMLERSSMLLCGEDLGTIPRICTDTLREFGIPGNDVQRWVKDWNIRHDFLLPQEYRYISVAMLSTHDTTSWAAWWEYEAGTIDEALFIRRCQGRGDYHYLKSKLFDPRRSSHGRLRWLDSVDSQDTLAALFGKPKHEIMDIVDMYENSYREKEKLWRHLRLPGAMRERADAEIVARALQFSLESQSILCINLITDWLSLSDILKEDTYQYRINVPGTVNQNNWSVIVPISLEALLEHPVNKQIHQMISDASRSHH